MPKRIPAQSITVVRKGQLVTPPLNEPFDFTASEIEDVERLNPAAFDSRTVVEGAAVVIKKVAATEPAAGGDAEGTGGTNGDNASDL